MSDKPFEPKHFAVGAVVKRRPFRIVMSGEIDVVRTVYDLSIDRVIDGIRSRSISGPPGMRSYSVTDESTGEQRSNP